jgi:hypothetical protein
MLRGAKRRVIAGAFFDALYFVLQYSLISTALPPPEADALYLDPSMLAVTIGSVACFCIALASVMRENGSLMTMFLLLQCTTIILSVRVSLVMWVFMLVRAASLVSGAYFRLVLMRHERFRLRLKGAAAGVSDQITATRAHVNALLSTLQAEQTLLRQRTGTESAPGTPGATAAAPASAAGPAEESAQAGATVVDPTSSVVVALEAYQRNSLHSVDSPAEGVSTSVPAQAAGVEASAGAGAGAATADSAISLAPSGGPGIATADAVAANPSLPPVVLTPVPSMPAPPAPLSPIRSESRRRRLPASRVTSAASQLDRLASTLLAVMLAPPPTFATDETAHRPSSSAHRPFSSSRPVVPGGPASAGPAARGDAARADAALSDSAPTNAATYRQHRASSSRLPVERAPEFQVLQMALDPQFARGMGRRNAVLPL